MSPTVWPVVWTENPLWSIQAPNAVTSRPMCPLAVVPSVTPCPVPRARAPPLTSSMSEIRTAWLRPVAGSVTAHRAPPHSDR